MNSKTTEQAAEEYIPVSCNHRTKRGFSNFELLSHSSGGSADLKHENNLSVCRGCGEVRISGYETIGGKLHRYHQEFSLYYPEAVAAIVKNCNWMNRKTDGYDPFVRQSTITELQAEVDRLRAALTGVIECTGSSTLQHRIAREALNL